MSASDFDWTSAPLSGMQLIEASAGTGKTWTLTLLYLRLLLETDLQPDRILVVTFTKAATAELKERLRQRLYDTWLLLSQAQPAKDDVERQLYQRYGGDTYLLRKLNAALRCFDRAAVYTIHGFCQRVLTDHAFSLGTRAAWTLQPDDSAQIKQLIDQFWTTYIASASGLWPLFLYTQRITPSALFTAVKPLLGWARYSRVLLPVTPNMAVLESAYLAAYTQAQTMWQQQQEQIQAAIQACKLGYRRTRFAKLTQIFAAPTAPIEWEQTAEGEALVAQFSVTTLTKIANDKNKPIPDHSFFHLITQLLLTHQALWQAFLDKQALTLAQLLHYCEDALPAVKQQRREMAYHDLLTQLEQALHDDQQGKVVSRLQRRFSAALIDEFQDTDPVQYRIFSRLYAGTVCPVLLIGDPKQAIYSFRGADIYTYLAAQTDTTEQSTLRVNYRSTDAVLTSLNALFSRNQAAFYLPQITYVQVQASASTLSLLDDPESTAALQCWKLSADSATGRINKETAAAQVIAATGAEIQRLLRTVKLGQKPVTAADIAILVPSHYYAALIRTHLLSIGVPAVSQGTENVLTSVDAYEWLRIFQAFLEPHRESLRKSALLTVYMGVDAVSLLAIVDDNARWEAIALQFAHYHNLWQRHGITRAFRTWLSEWDVAARLMRLPDGERRLTNLLHLIDILQRKSQAFPHLAMLVDWFTRQTVLPSGEEESSQLRLESDAARVKIMTIHAAKGLEFPIVFCPFLWHANGRENTHGPVIFHDETGQSHLDFGSAQQIQHRVNAQEELFAEKLRVLYVALTRAKYRNYIAWGKVNGAESAALAWLLYGERTMTLPAWMQQVRQYDDEAWWRPWQNLPETVLLPLPTQTVDALPHHCADTDALSAAVWHRTTLPCEQVITSFSALTQGHYPTAAEREGDVQRAEEEDAIATMAAFPAGARTGLCWHYILEHWDFRPGEHLRLLVKKGLQTYGFAAAWESRLSQLLLNVGQVTFAQQPLSAIAAAKRCSEMSFTFRLSAVAYTAFADVLQQAGEITWAKACQTLRFETATGMMTGFIDLVLEVDGRYFIVDYKSNRLGNGIDDYRPDKLRPVIASHHYYLQYLIYSVAVHRYLRQRQPEYHYDRHFGGVVYIFMRGLLPGTESGLFRDRPSWKLIDALDKLLDGER